MSCPVCEGTNLVPDDATGQLICSECGTATGVYHGLTQSQVYEEPRGLRVVGKVEPPSYDLPMSSQLTQMSTDLFEEAHPLQSGAVEAGLDAILSQSLSGGLSQQRTEPSTYPHYPDEEDSLLADEHFEFKMEKEREKRPSRPWRLSEPFTFIMRRQTEALARELNLPAERKQQLCETVWRLWLQYLAVTGELGNEAWLHAAASLTRSTRTMLRERTKYDRHTGALSRPNTQRNKTQKGLTTDEWTSVQSRIGQFHWVGWSTLYEPNEGREVVDLAHRTTKNFRSPSKSQPSKKSRKRKRRRSSTLDSSETSDLEAEDLSSTSSSFGEPTISSSPPPPPNKHSKSSSTPVTNRRTTRRNDNGDDQASILSDAVPASVHSVDDMCDLVVDNCDLDDSSVNFPNIANMKKQIARKLLQKNTWRRLLWRGQLEGPVQTQALLEHNLAVLFLAGLSIVPGREVVNSLVKPPKCSCHKHPVGLTKVVTLKDLYELCSDRRLPFVSVSTCLPPDLFIIHDRALLGLFRRSRPPRMDHLTRATAQMLHLTGLHQLPKFPLAWLMHRHIIVLGLPKFTHIVAELLVKRLRNRAKILSTRYHGHLNYWINWHRVLRPEVFAMAAVVIVLRIMFKFDDTSEFQLSRIAKSLETLPDDDVAYGQSLKSNQSPFVWTSWVSYIESRFQSTVQNLHDQSALQPNTNSHVINARKTDQAESLLKTATSASDLAGLDKASDFLGSYEFRIGQDEGWGENMIRKSKISDITTKLAMTGPLRELNRFDSNTQSSDSSNLDIKSLLSQNDQPKSLLGLVATRPELQGLQSPFRQSHLNFLYASQINTNCLVHSHTHSMMKYEPCETGFDLLSSWWSDLIKQRSFYHAICTGEWGMSSEINMIRKNRHRAHHEIRLPKPVEDLIDRHDEQLSLALDPASSTSNGLDLDAQEVMSAEHENNHVDVDNATDEENECESADKLSGKSKCSHCRKPSRSMLWLVELCSTVCGADNCKTLLTELECLERLLKWAAVPTCLSKSRTQVRITDIALLAAFDLNHLIPIEIGK